MLGYAIITTNQTSNMRSYKVESEIVTKIIKYFNSTKNNVSGTDDFINGISQKDTKNLKIWPKLLWS